MIKHFFIFIQILFLASMASAWPGRSGPEWTVTNEKLIELGR